METELKDLIGRKITGIFMNMDNLKFETDKGPLLYSVDGDCCSSSYFYDFYGIKNLLNNGPVIEIKEVALKDGEVDNDDDCISCYGYQITTESPEFGEITSVFSFRNRSNGYYGGSLIFDGAIDKENLPQITDDIIEIK